MTCPPTTKSTFRFTVALDLAKHKHVATIFDTVSGQARETTPVMVSVSGFMTFQAVLAKYSANPQDCQYWL